MLTLGAIGFTSPLLLLGLLGLPVLWLILRATPPAPVRRRFPGVVLLLGLTDDTTQTDKTPWWLLLLRMLALAAAIIGFAGPVLNPAARVDGAGPLLILADGTWAEARDWTRRTDRIAAEVEAASRSGRPVAVVLATDLPADGVQFQTGDAVLPRVSGLRPRPYVGGDQVVDWAAGLDGDFDTLWLSSGVDTPYRGDLLDILSARGQVTVFEGGSAVYALRPARFEGGQVRLSAVRNQTGVRDEITVGAVGPDPNGVERVLLSVPAVFEAAQNVVEIELDVPPELRNRITRFEIDGQRTAGAVTLTDDRLKRRKVALIAGRGADEGLELLSPLHYLNRALEVTADLVPGGLLDVLQANPDVIILADVATFAAAERDALEAWVDGGGMLVRFAGPRMAAAELLDGDPLLPVRLRSGGRSVGGAMSWGEPKTLRPFEAETPFAGLPVPEEVEITSQVLAEPGPDLAERTIAALSDGTPLVTRAELGAGQVLLFHVTANTEWSSLPLSGLFVQMLDRLAISANATRPERADLAGTTWVAQDVLDGFGDLQPAGTMGGIEGEVLATARASAEVPPGLYAGDDRRLAVNVVEEGDLLTPTAWPASVPVTGLSVQPERGLLGLFLSVAVIALALDALASLWVGGRLRGARVMPVIVAGLIALAPMTDRAVAQTLDDKVLLATSEVVLAHVLTGDRTVDNVANAGLSGLSRRLTQRTSIEPVDPVGVDLETDEIAVYPFLYWPITLDQPTPSANAYAKLNRYLRSGGMILFDTRDGAVAGAGGTTREGRRLQELARPLDIPPLEPIPTDHVLTRTFYLLQDFPGRHAGRAPWVEAAPDDAEQVDGLPFRNLNDGVTPVVIGGNDWASAWAVDRDGVPLFPVGRGYAGERQRETAIRFGINLIMHVLTGNYKSDQVHVPALLDRLGQ